MLFLTQFLKKAFNVYLIVKGKNVANIKKYKKGVKTKITNNFSSTEMDCKCNDPECKWTYIDVDHIEKLQKMRDKWKCAVKITSGYRCPKHNASIGSASNSRHVVGDATDIKVKLVSVDKVADDCEEADFDGLGKYNSFTHIDSRGFKSRWDFRKK